MKNLVLLSILVCALWACQSPQEDPDEKERCPNIILIIGDDQGYPYFGFMGADYVQTPHMDSLAASGTLFTKGYVPDNHCRPSLQSLLTGTLPTQYAVASRQRLADTLAAHEDWSEKTKEEFEREYRFHAMRDVATLPRLLAEKGYASFQGGKWWEYHYRHGGFTHGMTQGWTPEDRKQGGKWFKQFMGGSGLELVRVGLDSAYAFIDDHQDQAFFMWFAPELPHYPFNAPEKYYDLYRDQDMSESAKRYYANCSWFDEGVGALRKYIREKGLEDNTLFIYINDNGWEQEPHQEFRHDSLRWHNGGDKGKLSLYDQSFRTPIIFSWKDQIIGQVKSKPLLHSTDIPATILDYLGMPIPADYFGRSVKNLIEESGDEAAGRAVIIGEISQTRSEEDMMGRKLEGYWLRNAQWFFRWNATDEIKGLFDMEKDPRNDHDLAADYPELVKDFTQQINDWRKTMKDELN
ncbi:MAG: sulfatase-like hydrolase/transferase [Bacteroidota bacterium]